MLLRQIKVLDGCYGFLIERYQQNVVNYPSHVWENTAHLYEMFDVACRFIEFVQILSGVFTISFIEWRTVDLDCYYLYVS